jgi:1-acyl-sn-glycerol-3-phosphate acyltransferase
MKKKKEMYSTGYKFVRPFIRILLGIIYRPIAVHKEYIPKEGPIVFAGNHKHNYDPLLVCMSTRRMVHFMAKKELHQGKYGKFFEITGTISVDRGNDTTKSKEAAMEVLNNGYALGIFPEGTRNKTDKIILPFKYGAVSFAKKANATIVPFAITGDYKFNNDNLVIEFGKPFKPGEDLEETNKKLEDVVVKLLKKNTGKKKKDFRKNKKS